MRKGGWAIIWDFNKTLTPSESIGRAHSRGYRDTEDFCYFLCRINLIDMGYQGDSITWRNGRMGVRLDKSLISLDWRLMFQDAMIVHLEWMKSGHMPLLLRLDSHTKKN